MVQPYTDEKQENEAVPRNHYDTAPHPRICLFSVQYIDNHEDAPGRIPTFRGYSHLSGTPRINVNVLIIERLHRGTALHSITPEVSRTLILSA